MVILGVSAEKHIKGKPTQLAPLSGRRFHTIPLYNYEKCPPDLSKKTLVPCSVLC